MYPIHHAEPVESTGGSIGPHSLKKFLVLKEEINPVLYRRDYSFQNDGNIPSFMDDTESLLVKQGILPLYRP